MFFESFILNVSILTVLIAALIYDYVTKFFSYWYIRHIKYKLPLPFFGCDLHKILAIRNSVEEVDILYKRYVNEKLVGYFKSRIPDLIVKDPEIVKLICSSEFSSFQSRGICLDKTRDVILSQNLFYHEGETWKLMREKLEINLQDMVQQFKQNENRVDKYLQEVNGEINVRSFVDNIMEGITTDLLFIGLQSSEENILKEMVKEIRSRSLLSRFKSYLINIFPSVYNLLGLNIVAKISKNHFRKLFEKTRAFNLCTDEKKNPIDKNSCSVISFIAEGYVQCVNIMSCIIHELAKNQNIQSKARQLLGEGDESYLKCVIKETLRMYPQYPIVTRKCTKMYKFADSGLVLDKEITITIPIQNIHFDESYYELPNEFNPERFASSCDPKGYEDVYLPFGIGARKCIGEELSLEIFQSVIKRLLMKYKIQTAKKCNKVNLEDHRFSKVLTSRFYVKLEPI